MSARNRDIVEALTRGGLTGPGVELEFAVYVYDSAVKKYSKGFHSGGTTKT